MKEKVYAINICIIPSQEMHDICLNLNKLDTDSKYNKNSRPFIPHATLAMKYISAEKLVQIQRAIESLTIAKVDAKVHNPYVRYPIPGDSWVGINIEKNQKIKELQNIICDITQSFKNDERDRESYAIDDFFEENQLTVWNEKDFREKEEFHITLWKTDIKSHIDSTIFPKETVFDTLVIWHMWNYWSVREILYSKKLLWKY